MLKRKGFTLVEMLIVIAVIGVLAVAVLSAINPVEQMRKARDTRRRSNAAELLNALERYYTTAEAYPTDFASGVGTGSTCAVAATNQVVVADLADLVSDSEIKAEFSDRVVATDNYLYAAIDGTSDLAIVCYEIESAANLNKYSGGGSSNYCSDATAGNLVCLPE